MFNSWCNSLDSIHCHGWVVKAPFTTNSHFVKFPKTIEIVVNIIKSSPYNPEVGYGQIPYLMVQPCMHNRKEYKVVLLNHVPVFATSAGNKRCSNGINKSFVQTDRLDLYKFAEDQLTELKLNCPGAITDGLFRVDVLQNNDGTMVVNEFESLEASYYTTGNKEIAVQDFLFRYWHNKITNIFEINFTLASNNRFTYYDQLMIKGLYSKSHNLANVDILFEGHSPLLQSINASDDEDNRRSYKDYEDEK